MPSWHDAVEFVLNAVTTYSDADEGLYFSTLYVGILYSLHYGIICLTSLTFNVISGIQEVKTRSAVVRILYTLAYFLNPVSTHHRKKNIRKSFF